MDAVKHSPPHRCAVVARYALSPPGSPDYSPMTDTSSRGRQRICSPSSLATAAENNRFPSVDAPFLARENFRIAVARSRMLPSVRPVVQRWSAAGLYGSSRAGSKSPKACSRHCGKPWFSRPRLADCCAILSFRSPFALAIVVNLRRHDRSLVNAAFDQESPDHTGHLVSQGHSDQHLRLAWQHLCQP